MVMFGHEFQLQGDTVLQIGNHRNFAGWTSGETAWMGATFSAGIIADSDPYTRKMYVPIFKGKIEYCASLSQFQAKEQYKFIKDENYYNFNW